MRFGVASLTLLLAAAQAVANPYRVADLRQWASGLSSSPDYVGTVNGVVFFVATVEQDQRSLWRTDGTTSGTFALIDHFAVATEPDFLVSGNVLWFTRSERVWRSDGTIAGTAPLPDLHDVDRLVARNGDALYFLRTASRDLWVLDAAGERPLANVRTGFPAWNEGGSWRNGIFVANERGVWTSDGTMAGTTKLFGTAAWSAAAAGNRLYFVADHERDGVAELWTSDGTEAGTMAVSTAVGTPARTSVRLAAVGNRALLVGNGKIVVSDGTLAGTHTLRSGATYFAPQIAVLDGVAYFAFDDRTHGLELWRSDGTGAGTRLVSDTIIGAQGSTPRNITAGATRIYFHAQGGLHLSDGTAHGTRLLEEEACCDIATAGDRVFFGSSRGRYGTEPWIGDDTGVRLIANVREEPLGSSNPRGLVAGATRLFLVADSDDDAAIWSTDGTAAGTTLVEPRLRNDATILGAVGDTVFLADAGSMRTTNGGEPVPLNTSWYNPPPAAAGPHAAVGGRLLFFKGTNLWTTDGTLAGTRPLRENYRGVTAPLTVAGRTWIFGDVLAETDGTPEGTRFVAYPSGFWRPRSGLIPFRGALYLLGEDIGVYDGQRVARFSGAPGDAIAAVRFTASAGPLIGVAPLSNAMVFLTRRELWRSDGTPGGTSRLQEFGFESLYRYDTPDIVPLGDRAVFAALTSTSGYEPWVSDGTSTGTTMLRDLLPGVASSNPTGLLVADGIVYFAATDPVHGRELWQTDGTPEGTRLVADIVPGSGSSDPGTLTRFRDVLYFAATTPDGGRELWAYALPQATAITIDDARAMESQQRIAIPVRLTRAARSAVTVDYATEDGTAKSSRDYTSARGTLTFEPGETVKHVVVDIADVPTADNTRALMVRLSNATAPLERVAAAGIVEDDDRRADVGLSYERNTGPVIRNDGPDVASNIEFCYAAGTDRRCSTFTTLESGEISPQTAGSRGFVEATVRPWEPDPNPENNTLTYESTYNGSLVASPAVLRVGQTGKLFVRGYLLQFERTVASSDPSIVSLAAPEAAETDFIATYTALQPGTATISVARTAESVRVHVIGAEEPMRAPAFFQTYIAPLYFGSENGLIVDVLGARVDGTKATGSIEVLIDGAPLASGTAGTRIQMWLRKLPPGAHEIEIRYSGDAHFFGEVRRIPVTVQKATVTPRATEEDGAVTISLRGVIGFAPTGSVTVGDTIYPLVAEGSIARATIGAVPSDTRQVTLTYSGDALYRALSSTVVFERTRGRTMRH